MAKFKKKYLKPANFKTEGHWMVGFVWNVVGSKGNNYSVELHDEGFECDCIGFGYHGYCKHSKQIVKKLGVT